MQAAAEDATSQIELFMNSVQLLSSLTREEKLQLVDAFSEETFVGETEALCMCARMSVHVGAEGQDVHLCACLPMVTNRWEHPPEKRVHMTGVHAQVALHVLP